MGAKRALTEFSRQCVPKKILCTVLVGSQSVSWTVDTPIGRELVLFSYVAVFFVSDATPRTMSLCGSVDGAVHGLWSAGRKACSAFLYDGYSVGCWALTSAVRR